MLRAREIPSRLRRSWQIAIARVHVAPRLLAVVWGSIALASGVVLFVPRLTFRPHVNGEIQRSGSVRHIDGAVPAFDANALALCIAVNGGVGLRRAQSLIVRRLRCLLRLIRRPRVG